MSASHEITSEKARRFTSLHVPGDPLILYNCWDALTARLAASAFPAIATSSGAIATAQGFQDGETTPLDLLLDLVERIVDDVAAPVSCDIEAGYSNAPASVADTYEKLIECGTVGINLEDGLSHGKRTLVDADAHGRKIAAIRERAEKIGVPFFINARTDPYILGQGSPEEQLAEVKRRAKIYASCGASGLFVPRLIDLGQIADLVGTIDLPINIMAEESAPSIDELAKVGVARVSLGGWPIIAFSQAFGDATAKFAGSLDYSAIAIRHGS